LNSKQARFLTVSWRGGFGMRTLGMRGVRTTVTRNPATLAALLLLARLAAPGPLPAQLDYRNLDDDRPTVTEDAYPVERYAFEFLLPYA
jgi:hypothetical protein